MVKATGEISSMEISNVILKKDKGKGRQKAQLHVSEYFWKQCLLWRHYSLYICLTTHPYNITNFACLKEWSIARWKHREVQEGIPQIQRQVVKFHKQGRGETRIISFFRNENYS